MHRIINRISFDEMSAEQAIVHKLIVSLYFLLLTKFMNTYHDSSPVPYVLCLKRMPNKHVYTIDSKANSAHIGFLQLPYDMRLLKMV